MTVRSATPLLVVWGLCLAVLAAFHLAYVMPQERALAARRDQIRTKAERFDLLTKAKSPREQERIKTRQEELEREYAAFVFGSEEMGKLDFAIRGVAEKNGLPDFSARHVGTTSAIGDTKLKHIVQREMVLSFTSDFPSFLHFVNELERLQPIVFVNQFTIRSAPAKSAKLACDMECSVLCQSEGK